MITVKSTNYIKFLFPADTSFSVCKGSSISYNVNTDATLKWDPCTFLSSCDSKTVKITPANDITYTITGINRVGCKGSAYLKIHILPALDSVYIPNAFTPNGDRLNDTFGPLSSNRWKKLIFDIYNRWGNTVFSSKEQNYKWDGTFKGIAQPSGVYIYTLTYIQGDGCELKQKRELFK
ncbi:MAG: gliding motility-associated C-terminal domain-containing protein [Segetibacter sp.]